MKRTDFEIWKAECGIEDFCSDGIINGSIYGGGIPRILFLLKDANAEKGKYTDIRAVLKEVSQDPKKDFGAMWRVICYWTMILEDPSVTFNEATEKDRREYLEHIAVVNICKEAGVGSNRDQKKYENILKNAVNNYYDRTLDEIREIAPEIVICGKTYDYIKKQYNCREKTLSCGVGYFIDEENGTVYVDMCHPGNRIGYVALFALFKQTVDSLITENVWKPHN